MYIIVIRYDGELIILDNQEFSTLEEAEEYEDTLDGSKVTLRLITWLEYDLRKIFAERYQKV